MQYTIRQQIRGAKNMPCVAVRFCWVERDRRRDLDNICAFGTKVILDSLQKEGIIAGDGWRNIKGITHDFFIDREKPRIEVIIKEVENHAR